MPAVRSNSSNDPNGGNYGGNYGDHGYDPNEYRPQSSGDFAYNRKFVYDRY